MLVQMRQCHQCKQLREVEDVFYEISIRLERFNNGSPALMDNNDRLDRGFQMCSVSCINQYVGKLTNQFVRDINDVNEDKV